MSAGTGFGFLGDLLKQRKRIVVLMCWFVDNNDSDAGSRGGVRWSLHAVNEDGEVGEDGGCSTSCSGLLYIYIRCPDSLMSSVYFSDVRLLLRLSC